MLLHPSSHYVSLAESYASNSKLNSHRCADNENKLRGQRVHRAQKQDAETKPSSHNFFGKNAYKKLKKMLIENNLLTLFNAGMPYAGIIIWVCGVKF